MSKQRMTAQSKVNIGAAVKATLVPHKDGYKVTLEGSSGKTCDVENASGPIVYSSMASARKAVEAHNSKLNPTLKPTI